MTRALDVGNCIRIACRKKGMSMRQVSLSVGKRENWLNSLATKRDALPTYRSMMMICKALNVGFVELLIMNREGFRPAGYRTLRPDLKRCIVRACRIRGTGMCQASLNAGMCHNWLAAVCDRNRPSMRTLSRMSDALDMSVVELLTCWSEK
jgi:lambda repressor-like predicted transcriptional regulator